MLKSVVRELVETDEKGDAQAYFNFDGYIEEIFVEYGDVEMDTVIEFETSSRRTFQVVGNKPENFPINPRHSPNSKGMQHFTGTDTVLERYVNCGSFKVRISGAGENKKLALVEIVYWE